MALFHKFRTLGPYLARYRRAYLLGAVWIVLTSAFGQAVPWLMGRAVDSLRGPTAGQALGFLCGAIVVAALLQGIFRYRMRLDIIGASRWIEYALRRDLFQHLLRLPPSWYDRHRTGDLMTRSTSDLEAIRQVVGPALMYFSNTVLIVTSSLALMLWIDPRLTLLALLPMTLLSIVVRVVGREVHTRTLAVRAQESRMADRVQETLSGIRVVKSYVQEDHEVGAFAHEARRLVDRNMHLVKVWGLFFPSMALIVGAAAVLTLWMGGRAVIAGNISLGDFVAFNAYLMRLTWPMISIGWVLNLVERGAASMARVDAILATEPELREVPGVRSPGAMRGQVDLEHVGFAYAGGPRVLHDVDLHVKAGETVAIVGPTGSGKSTLLALIARLYDCDAGHVRIDGHDVRDVPLGWLRSHLALVPQDTFLFSDTIRRNLEFGSRQDPQPAPTAHAVAESSGALAAPLRDAIRIAQLEPALALFPRGVDTKIGERGITLSGGQKQRVAIARALLRDPRVLLLDDCFSSVDTETEERMLRALEPLFRERTTILVAHRVSTIRSVDRVVVLVGGEIVESGTHDALVQAGGYYAKLVEKQMLREEIERGATLERE